MSKKQGMPKKLDPRQEQLIRDLCASGWSNRKVRDFVNEGRLDRKVSSKAVADLLEKNWRPVTTRETLQSFDRVQLPISQSLIQRTLAAAR